MKTKNRETAVLYRVVGRRTVTEKRHLGRETIRITIKYKRNFTGLKQWNIVDGRLQNRAYIYIIIYVRMCICMYSDTSNGRGMKSVF